ncbi:MAG: hypothetical protein OSA51_13695 [Octadecabacter sp.]|nr:hypothetical protein [Octadecabacter sp.]
MADVCGVWRALIKGRVRSFSFVEHHPVIDDAFCLEAVGDFMYKNGLMLEESPQASD